MKLVIAFTLLAAALVQAQDAPPASPTPDAQVVDATGASDYGGPSILSRGGAASILRIPVNGFRPFVTLNGIYDTGLGTTSVDSSGKVNYSDGYGVETMFGVTGGHAWKTSTLELSYRGAFRHYNNATYYDGMDNSFNLGYQRLLGPHTTLVLNENAARYARSFSLPISTYYNIGQNAYDPNYTGLATNNLFDNPTTALMSSARIIHQFTQRLSVSAGGSGFLMRRHSSALVGNEGYSATGDIAYRLTRYQTVSLGYNFNHFQFQRRFGQSDIHGVSLGYAIRVGRYWELGLSGGGFRTESNNLTAVPLDPVIAKILGQNFVYVAFHQTTFTPYYAAHITRSFRYGSATAGFTRTVIAGNDLYGTSDYDTFAAGYSYTGRRPWTFQFGGNYSSYKGFNSHLGRYHSYDGSVGVERKLGIRGLTLIGRFDARSYDIANSNFSHIYYRIVVGLGWSPGDIPISLW